MTNANTPHGTGHDSDALERLIREDRAARPAPELSDAAFARIMAEMPPARPDISWQERLRDAIARWVQPPVWQALAVAGAAGVIAGSLMPATGPESAAPAYEDEFMVYTGSESTFAYLLEEDA